jgi:membrane-bound lytic murein transglycosylase F
MQQAHVTKQQWLIKFWLTLSLVAVVVVIAVNSGNQHQYDDVVESGVLKIITRNSPTTYFQDRDQSSGFEYELALKFAEYLGVTLQVEVADSLDDLITEVESGNVAFAAAGLTVTDARSEHVTFADSYMKVTQQLIYRTDRKRPKSMQSMLEGTLMVTAHSSHAQQLRHLQKTSMPELTWIERDDAEVSELVQMVQNGEIDFTIVDSNEFKALSGFYPRVRTAFNVSESQNLAWAFAKFSDNKLLSEAHNFFHLMRETGLLAQLQERYYGHQNQLDNMGTLTFLRQADSRLNKYQPLFEKTALKHDVDWRLLAAIGYQESHWRSKARSRTGVRGLMMLTRTTAKEMGVSNRLDATQSIVGGSAYFAKLKKRYAHINEPDRTWLSLASYNVGAGHVRDAQKLTEQQGGDPERWMDVKDRLPLLSKKKYYKKTQYGYARGYEPVHYVQNIRKFYDLLVWREQPEASYTMLGEGSTTTASNTYTTIPPLTDTH